MSSPFRLFILCGEPSGDRYAGHLAASIHRFAPEVQIYGVGGTHLFERPVEPIEHLRSLSVSGFTSVIRHLPSLVRARHRILQRIRKIQPDAVIMIDFPDFHFSIAQSIRNYFYSERTPLLIYYIPPQIWIWRKKRIRLIRKLFDAVIPAFPFETELYRQQQIPFFYAGHPIIDALQAQNQVKIQKKPNAEKYLLLLPGSRPNEIQSILPMMLKSIHLYATRNTQEKMIVKIARVSEIPENVYQNIIHLFLKFPPCENISIELSENFYDDLLSADVALSKPGTNNLELAFYGIPFLIVYRTHFLNWLIIRLAVKLSFASLVNILSAQPIVREFIQSDALPENIANEIDRMIHNDEYRLNIIQSLKLFCQKNGLHNRFCIADENAKFILSLIQTKNSSNFANDS